MRLSDSARITYSAGIPTVTGTVTLFNSVTAFPPGGSLHLLGQQWFQYSLRTASDGGTATGTVTGSYSTDKGVTWLPFYTKSTADADDDNAAAVADVFMDEVYIGSFKDVRFQYTNAVEQLTIFDPLLSLHVRKPKSKVSEGAQLGLGPIGATAGAVTSWFRLGDPLSAITGAGYSRIEDVLDRSNPLLQGTDNKRPPNATSANGLPIMTMATAFMPFALTAARQNNTTWGMWGWFKQATNADNTSSIGTSSGSSAKRQYLFFRTSGTGLRTQVWTTDTTSRVGDITGMTAAQWNFITIEYNGNRSGDARLAATVNGVVQTLSFSSGDGVASMPATLVTATGNGSMFAFTSGGPYFVGSMGPNFGFLGSAMVGATEGLLTPAARAALMAFEAPT